MTEGGSYDQYIGKNRIVKKKIKILFLVERWFQST